MQTAASACQPAKERVHVMMLMHTPFQQNFVMSAPYDGLGRECGTYSCCVGISRSQLIASQVWNGKFVEVSVQPSCAVPSVHIGHARTLIICHKCTRVMMILSAQLSAVSIETASSSTRAGGRS